MTTNAKRTPSDERRSTAYHEAGHVVAYYVHRCYLGSATVEPCHVKGTKGTAGGEEASGEVEAINLYAGLAGQRLADPDATVESGGAWDDYDAAAEIVSRYCLDAPTLQARAAEIVARHRDKVDAVASLLIEEGTVDGEDLAMVCEAVAEGCDWRDALAKLRALRSL